MPKTRTAVKTPPKKVAVTAASLRLENRALKRTVRALQDENKRLRATRGSEASRSALTKLRDDVRVLQERNGELEKRTSTLLRSLARAREDGSALRERVDGVEREYQRVSQQYVESEQTTAFLSNLCVASLRLHESLEREQVLRAIHEIIANLIGSEEFAVYECARGSSELERVSFMGPRGVLPESIRVGEGLAGQCAATGEIYVASMPTERGASAPAISACIPLRLDGRVTGLVLIGKLLRQKPALRPGDREMFRVLASSAASALYCTGLHARVGAIGEA